MSMSLVLKCSNKKCKATKNIHKMCMYLGGIYYSLCGECAGRLMAGLENGLHIPLQDNDPWNKNLGKFIELGA